MFDYPKHVNLVHYDILVIYKCLQYTYVFIRNDSHTQLVLLQLYPLVLS